MTTPHDIAKWLETLPNVRDVLPFRATINGTHYPAASYTQTFTTPEGSEAYRRGERTYDRESVYVVGMLPAVKRNGNVAFRMPSDKRDWYVVTYAGDVRNRKQEVCEPSEYHPFGNAFQLMPWDVKDATIDQYERHPYKRVPVSVAADA